MTNHHPSTLVTPATHSAATTPVGEEIRHNRAHQQVVFRFHPERVYLSLVRGLVLCEDELILGPDGEEFVAPRITRQLFKSVLRRSSEIKYLGSAYNATPILGGEPTQYYLVELTQNPDPRRYSLYFAKDIFDHATDGTGMIAIGLAMVKLKKVFKKPHQSAKKRAKHQ